MMQLRDSLTSLSIGLAFAVGFAVVAISAQPTSAWFSDLSSVPLSVSAGKPDPQPPSGVEIVWTGHGDEHATRVCDGPARWHLVLTGKLSGADAVLTASFEQAGEVGPVVMTAGGKPSNGALHATIQVPAGDTLTAAVATLEVAPEKKTKLVLSDSTCVDDPTTEERRTEGRGTDQRVAEEEEEEVAEEEGEEEKDAEEGAGDLTASAFIDSHEQTGNGTK